MLAPSKPEYNNHSSDPSVPRLTLYWSPPSAPNGVITKYTLYHHYLPDGNVTIVTIMDPNTRNSTVQVIGGLTYNFSLSATTVEEGPKWSQLISTPEYSRFTFSMIYKSFEILKTTKLFCIKFEV